MTPDKKKTPIHPERIVDPRTLPHATPRWRGNLPHISKEGCTYFCTFCLIDAVDKKLRHGKRFESPGDGINLAGEHDPAADRGSCLLKDPVLASMVEDALLHFQADRYALSAWCVMPNHVHVVVTPYKDWGLSTVLHSWKSYSAHEINKRLGRRGPVWEDEAFDHMVRNEQGFERFVRYTEGNPVTAGLCSAAVDWPFSSARYR